MQANSLQLKQLQIKNFRCFSHTVLNLDAPLVLIQGLNGSGKTSILEALHYTCYLRSFRTHSPRDLIQFGHEGFFIKALFNNTLEQSMLQEIQVGFSGKKRLVKVNQKPIASYKELMQYYRIITLTEDDLRLINDGPEIRRAFIDQALLLDDPDFINSIREFKHILDNRNAMLVQGVKDAEAYDIWTDKLLFITRQVQERRMHMLAQLEQETRRIIHDYFDNRFEVSCVYMPKRYGPSDSMETFNAHRFDLYSQEKRFCRSLFGAHLDDFIITFQDKKSKAFASRGQQKLIMLLMKIAQLKTSKDCGSVTFLLDDFMTDFDPERVKILLSILGTLENQLIFTSPALNGLFENMIKERGGVEVKLTP